MRTYSLALLLFFPFYTFAQNTYLDDWQQAVGWDGLTHWSRYMQTVPGLMGPNALPVPFTKEGSADSITSLLLSVSHHRMKGDRTSNITLYFSHPVVNNKVSIELFVVPVEWFETSREVKLERRVVPHHFNDRTAVGDIHGNVSFQVFNKIRDRIHMVVRAGMRYPTSNKLGAARFTDMPGYYFDVNAGKPLNDHWKLFANAGFYVWETIHKKLNRQDDAFLFGAGFSFGKNNFHWQTAVSGYLGYMEELPDKPIVLRTTVTKDWKRYRGFVRLQQGIKDIKYTTLELGSGWIFGSLK